LLGIKGPFGGVVPDVLADGVQFGLRADDALAVVALPELAAFEFANGIEPAGGNGLEVADDGAPGDPLATPFMGGGPGRFSSASTSGVIRLLLAGSAASPVTEMWLGWENEGARLIAPSLLYVDQFEMQVRPMCTSGREVSLGGRTD
jgi:hypothetical protein